MQRPSQSTRLTPLLPLLLLVLGQGCFEAKTRVELLVQDQDINQSESAAADKAIKALLGIDSVYMVYCRRDDLYEVHSRDGLLVFARVQGDDAYGYEIVRQDGANPLGNQDPKALPDLASELAAGSNPNQVDYQANDPGYSGPDDPRISFAEADAVSYPLAYERIAALFDGPRAGDLVIEFKPWGWYTGDDDNHAVPTVSDHGMLNVITSRGPLVIAGKGARKKRVVDNWARSVDLAPTVAHAMGIAKTYGVDSSGHYSRDVYLKWQDGHVLDDALDGQRPGRVLILVNDALSHTELMHMLSTSESLPAYRWLVQNGTLYKYGQIVNFPSNTYASHNVIVTGAYSGHHGLVDNWFYERLTGKREDPLTALFDTGKFLTDDVETLFEAVHRSFDNWHPQDNPLGNFTLTINGPATRGADHALLEGVRPIDWDQCPEPEGLDLPPADPGFSQRGQASDNLGVTIFAKAFIGKRTVDGKQVPCTQPPRLSYINLGLTDDAAHEVGAHADAQRQAIIQTDRRMQILFDVMKKAGVFDDTLIIFTSDHGQILRDHSRISDYKPVLRQAGIGFQGTLAFVYLLTFDVGVKHGALTPGESTTVTVTVRDDDTGQPVAGAKVSLESGGASVSGETTGNGSVALQLTPGADKVTLSVEDASSVEQELRHTPYETTLK